MENRYKTKKLRVGKRTADYSTGAHSLADDLVRGEIIEKSAREYLEKPSSGKKSQKIGENRLVN
jgi:hypothetical protein